MAKNKLVITAVEYLNTSLFVEGLRDSLAIQENFELVLDNPAGCSKRMLEREADIGLVPVASISQIRPKFIFNDFCIGANQQVRTVRLFSNTPVNKLKKIYVDSHSRTSVRLLHLLCREHWKIQVDFEEMSIGDLSNSLHSETGILAIGDKVFNLESNFDFSYDLAEEWMKYTSTEFVFAVWLSRIDLSDDLVNIFKSALRQGIAGKDATIQTWAQLDRYKDVDVEHYLTHNISYPFSDAKKKGLELFLNLSEIDQVENIYR